MQLHKIYRNMDKTERHIKNNFVRDYFPVLVVYHVFNLKSKLLKFRKNWQQAFNIYIQLLTKFEDELLIYK